MRASHVPVTPGALSRELTKRTRLVLGRSRLT
jgi:hypothetical protein